ncbi:GNAT family N-acetyltransferase [Photobacterium sp. ZSDE20]|uniref:GNAT family N-acetyltransferase n=1 Tax=Photobacterium pectinilyticum TaxID=2906793 RepID=A0ABT1MZG5_9GAMM|nr:GNAT family N-acetyltransferase [Photobacterium sp. ZSDE20]MCQ1057907.1 GNAT family N-acetyltransferase [Photobacterium sp. ZSDE20]MDD1822439.1 GNAT family N-acetyltransferase [Photobacterium sp. ZSDE20]
MHIREASTEEAVTVLVAITEFARPATEDELKQRLRVHRALILVAEIDGELAGVKIGYQLSEDCFYSWLGGVAPAGRRSGVAQALLEAQEAWVLAQGYQTLRVKSRNRFPAMLRLLLRNGYQIEHLEKKDGIEDFRLHFVKQLNDNNSQ